MSPAVDSSKRNNYGSFLLAATAYIAGVLLFLFWSYTTHRNVLINHIDKTLEDAAFAAHEILTTDSTGSVAIAEMPMKHIQLTGMAKHGEFSTIGAAEVKQDLVTLLIAASSNTNIVLANHINEHMPLPGKVQRTLIRIAETAQSGTTMLSVKNPADSPQRYAIFYTATGPDEGTAYLAAQESHILQKQLFKHVIRLLIAGAGMMLLAIPLILLFNRTKKKAAAELSEMNIRLRHDMELQKSREAELKDAISDLERFNAVTAGRESRIIELKAEINTLLAQMNQDKRYNIEHTD